MKEILKTLKKYFWQIIIVISLLIIQAYCDLSLPTYTSNIVNVGIQQKGIESYVPEILRESEYKKLEYMLSGEDKNVFYNSYTYIPKGSKKESIYPILKEEGVYELSKENDKLNEILLYPIFILSNKDKFDSIENIDLSNLTYEEIINTIKEKIDGNDSLLEQMNISYTESEYKAVGIDIDKLQMNYILITGAKMLLIAVLAMGITIISVRMSTKIASSFSKDLRKKVVNKVMSFESEEMKKFSTASLLTRSTNDIVQVQVLVTVFLRIIIYAPILGFGAITKVIGSSMGWVIALSVIVILSLILVLFIVVLPKFKKFQDLLDKLNLVTRETLSGLPVIRAFANERHEEKRFESANDNLTRNGLFVNRTMAIMSPTLTFLMNSVSILIVWVGAEKIDASIMQVGDLIAFISYTMQIIMSFLMVSMVAIMLPRAAVSIRRISEIFKTEVSTKDKDKTLKLKNEKIKEVEFKDVYFRYPEATEDVLRNISFKAPAGTTTAFIGSTGSGKSTLINLIPRFFDITDGKILIDGIDIRDIKIKDLRDKIGYVPQKGQLFTGNIESNLSLGMNKKDESKLEEAARISQSLEFINENEEGMKREISQGGTNVSGGQRQRLSIARAIAKDPEIYIFDDSFSALDYKTDAMLRKELNKTTKDKIVFVVAQRISSVMHADNIIVLDNGSVVGMGTHEELMKSCEVYKEIKISQLGGDDNE